MPKRVNKSDKDENYGFKSLLGDIAKMAGGKKSPKLNFYVEAAKNLFSFSGFDQQVTRWFLTKALTNPNIAKSLFKIRGMITEGNAETFLNFSLAVLIPSDNEISILLGVISIGIVHKQFPIKGDHLKECRSEVKKLLIHEDSKVKDAATVILELLGDSVVDKDSARAARKRLTQGGVDISKVIKGK
jgi:hypothetical protein